LNRIYQTKHYFHDPLIESVIGLIRKKDYELIDTMEDLTGMLVDEEMDEFLESWK